MKIKLIGLLCMCVLCFASCNKKAGEGGTGTVQGYVSQINHPDDNYNLNTDTVAGSKTDVFIVYGNSDFYGDDVETDENGFYQFKYLTKGDYTVFSYSIKPDGTKIPVKASVSIGKGETANAPTLYIHSGKAYGTSVVKGKVLAKYIDKNGLPTPNATACYAWAYEHRVYIRNLGETYHFDDVRVGLDGIFAFQKLQPGEYEVFTFSENQYEILSPVIDTVIVEKAGQIIEMEPDTTFLVTIKV